MNPNLNQPLNDNIYIQLPSKFSIHVEFFLTSIAFFSCETNNDRTPAEPADDQYLFQVGCSSEIPATKPIQKEDTAKHIKLYINSFLANLDKFGKVFFFESLDQFVSKWTETICINFNQSCWVMRFVGFWPENYRGQGFEFHGGSVDLWSARVVGVSKGGNWAVTSWPWLFAVF